MPACRFRDLTIISGDSDGKVSFWDGERYTRLEVSGWKGGVTVAAFSAAHFCVVVIDVCASLLYQRVRIEGGQCLKSGISPAKWG